MYKQITVGTLTQDPNGICEDQTTAGADDLSLDGDLVSGGVATAAEAQIVAIEGSGDNSGIDFTVTGTDADGKTISETIDGANNGTAKTSLYFKTVTGISCDGAVTGNVEAGWLAADGMVTKSIPVNHHQTPFNMSLFFDLTAGTMTVSARFTEDAPNATYTNSFSSDANWKEVDGMDSITADAEGNIAYPVRAVQFIQEVGSATGECVFTAIQGR